TPLAGAPLNRQVFYFIPGVADQARALFNFAASKPELKKARAAIVASDSVLASAVASAVEEQSKRAAWGTIARRDFRAGSFDAAQHVRELKQSGADAVFLFCANGEESAFIKAAVAAGWSPHVFLVGVLAGHELVSNVPADFKDRIFLTFPTVPGDITPEVAGEYTALLERHKFARRNIASQLAALAAAKVFVEALKRSGREVTRERLINALEGLYDFETGITPRLTFGPNRRVGAQGAYIVTIDPEKKNFMPASGWVSSN
ncbi:MAG: ABC transporter substrate-binding protein, partial [Rubrivivax sp.]|nr:ABC transporter substrate-binding protein [Pyrinomonadaceae bacterium]